MLKLIHLTDLHFTPPGIGHLGCQPRRRLEAAVESINTEHGDAAWVVITGDLAALGQSAAYEELKACLAELRVPYRLCLGNGDHRARFRAVFRDVEVDDTGFVQSVVETPAGRLLLLDTLVQGVHWGELCERRLAWLSRQLEQGGAAPVFLFMHHPPFPIGIKLIDSLSLKNADRLAALLDGRNIRHMFLGHAHRPVAGSWRGIPFTILRSTVSQFALRLDSDQPLRCYESPFYAVVLIDEAEVIVHFHDYGYDGAVFQYDTVPNVVVDDETRAADFQQSMVSAASRPACAARAAAAIPRSCRRGRR
ncbi:MAG: phosphodiesterase [Kiloniellales bacterium]|nr:phosphodiesterase [Kiloniellales bacterium]